MSARAISGTRRAMKELVDGTLRVSIDIDPECRRDFLRLFSEIDMRVALAPLRAEAKPAANDAAGGPMKGGELCRLAAILCGDEEFQKWIELETPAEHLPTVTEVAGADAAEIAAIAVRRLCGVKSRAELDHNPHAAAVFHERIRKPWMAFKGAAA